VQEQFADFHNKNKNITQKTKCTYDKQP